MLLSAVICKEAGLYFFFKWIFSSGGFTTGDRSKVESCDCAKTLLLRGGSHERTGAHLTSRSSCREIGDSGLQPDREPPCGDCDECPPSRRSVHRRDCHDRSKSHSILSLPTCTYPLTFIAGKVDLKARTLSPTQPLKIEPDRPCAGGTV